MNRSRIRWTIYYVELYSKPAAVGAKCVKNVLLMVYAYTSHEDKIRSMICIALRALKNWLGGVVKLASSLDICGEYGESREMMVFRGLQDRELLNEAQRWNEKTAQRP